MKKNYVYFGVLEKNLYDGLLIIIFKKYLVMYLFSNIYKGTIISTFLRLNRIILK